VETQTLQATVEPTRTDIGLRCVRVVVWAGREALIIDEADLPTMPGREAVPGGPPTWVQLALPWLTRYEQQWFEGSVNPWRDTQAPAVDWTGVEDVLERVGLGSAALDGDERRLLQCLPFLYARGIARVAREIWGTKPPVADRLTFFPTAAFRPVGDIERPRFWTVRMTVGVIRNVVVTVRLPDLWWDDESGHFGYTPDGPLDMARRFVPVADDLTAHDVAEAISLQQASTARAVTYQVRTRVTDIERRWRLDVASSTRASRDDALEDVRSVIEMTDHVFQLDRQVSRLLRRLEPGSSGTTDRHTPPEIAVRYRFALDELRSLAGNCNLASEAVGQAITTGDQEDRERFHFVAAVLASAILIPTLVASIYGANVNLPAEDSWRGFIALLLFIVAFAVAGLFVIAESLRRGWVPGTARLRGRPVRIGAAAVAALAFAGGVLEVM
jgi:CorA-like Mg2+ transporter protein